ncbi:hypothetical protein CHS0354_007444 [Potamilus streckersoni]|uniref:CUB domain-containing protein n=1 Tax=Potamilus streckersoni TaxID=2493646 RepID=A0AAE0SWH8_9BIVA|nr:hypothetical protein CHS0354_007444 [Potamilus streckersoni]
MESHNRVVALFTFIILIYISLVLTQIPESTVILQNQYGDCSSIWNPQERYLQDRDEYIVVSQTVEQTFYASEKNCVVSIIGKLNYQWEIRITTFDVDSTAQIDASGNPRYCGDFVKLYDSQRPDNAKLLKGINFKTGLCGTLSASQIGVLVFSTCANTLTIQFKTDKVLEFKRGFALALKQSPWSNPVGGPDCDPSLSGISEGGWMDGTDNEFQNNWDEQPLIPGNLNPGGGNNYDKEPGGISCYKCVGCPVEPFDPTKDVTATDTGCYVCSKSWDSEYMKANRDCYTRVQYRNLLLTFRDNSDPFTGCKQIPNDYGRIINYCFCLDNLCNKSSRITGHTTGLLMVLFTVLFRKLLSLFS